MGLTLASIPGFADVSDASLAHDKYALGALLARINQNAAFGMVRLEVFAGTYSHGDKVPLPVSAVDGYPYRQDEITYVWAPQNTADPKTGTASAGLPWAAWYYIWNVDADGNVACAAGYRGNNDHPERQMETNDGTLHVMVIAQRQKGNLVLSAPPAMTVVGSASLGVDKALTESVAQAMNRNAKFAVVNTEVMYLGEFSNGDTFARPVSPIDGYAYSNAEIMLMASWVFTCENNAGQPNKPAISKGQLQDFSYGFSGTGPYTVALKTMYGNGLYNDGRVAVFAFCQRATGSSIWTAAGGFSEISDSTFAPGSSLRSSTMVQLNANTREAIGNPEFFGPTDYANGAVVPLPVSPIDGYAYSRDECRYICSWHNTAPPTDASASQYRVDLLRGGVDDLGNVTVDEYRVRSSWSTLDLQHNGRLSVIVVAKREGHPVPIPVDPVYSPSSGFEDTLAIQDAIVHYGKCSGGGGNCYDYRKFSTLNYAIQAGDRLEYDVFVDPSCPDFKAAVEFKTGSHLTALIDTGLADQNGVPGGGNGSDLSKYAVERWYHRTIDLSTLAGQTISEWYTALEGDAAGTYLVRFANIRVSNNGAVQAMAFSSAEMQGYMWGLPVAGNVNYTAVKTYTHTVSLIASGNNFANNTASVFTGGNPLSQSGTSTTILVAACTIQFGFGQVSYNSGSVNPGAYGTYYVYADDPGYAGGAVTYLVTTVGPDVFSKDGRIFFGKIVTAGGGGGTGGGGGGGCPMKGAPVRLFGDPSWWRVSQAPCEDFVMLRTANRQGFFSPDDMRYCRRGLVKVSEFRAGDWALTEDGEEMVLEALRVHVPGGEIDSYEAVDGHVYSAWGFIGHNNKIPGDL